MRPNYSWKKPLNDPHPSSSVHNYSTPPIVEALSLLPLAYRVSSYIAAEKKAGRGTVFDLNGATLHPPHPGPYAGCPLGGVGAGSIGRGYRGDFRRWSLQPGKYIHQTVEADQFSIRVHCGGEIQSVVLSIFKTDRGSGLNSWNFGKLSPTTMVYESVFPRAWTIIDEVLPNFKVIIRQVSPFLPDTYSETSFPVCLFHVNVENLSQLDAEVSVMFSFQNGGVTGVEGSRGQKCHSHFHQSYINSEISSVINANSNSSSSSNNTELDTNKPVDRRTNILGVCMTTLETEQESRTRSRSRATSSASSAAQDIEKLGCSVSCVAGSDGELSFRSENISVSALPRSMSSGNIGEGVGSGVPGCEVTCAFAIAAQCGSDITGDSPDGVLSHCVQFVISSTQERKWGSAIFGNSTASHTSYPSSPETLWQRFHLTGDLTPIPVVFTPAERASPDSSGSRSPSPSPSRHGVAVDASGNSHLHSVCHDGTVSGAAVCLRKSIPAGTESTYSFSLAWDMPYTRFGGTRKQLPKYYTRFWGRHKVSAHALASYALLRATDWENHICRWQEDILRRSDLAAAAVTSRVNIPSAGAVAGNNSKLSKTSNANSSSSPLVGVSVPDYYKHMIFNELYFIVDGGTIWTDSTNGEANPSLEEDESGATTSQPSNESGNAGFLLYQQLNIHSYSMLSAEFFNALVAKCTKHDAELQNGSGEQQLVGQFLYLEGHEYLMYNTYDVHFYASFALLQVFPQLELSIQRDFAIAVAKEDFTQRKMLANGNSRPRKVKGAVPHDLGSPYEYPWQKLNSYILQDVSRWKDLGPKFVLQVFRDFQFISARQVATSDNNISDKSKVLYKPSSEKGSKSLETFLSTTSAFSFLSAVFPAVISAMESTHEYDRDGDGMIENEGFPDQTYDIWTAEGVHAYCGGLWIAANEAAAEMSYLLGVYDRAEGFKLTASRARVAYIDALWNGSYLNYDSSSSSHSSSIMADMLAGHWYARVCALPGVIPTNMALSCLDTIFDSNVKKFGGGSWMGAVNGMNPNGTIDSTCMQSREVWTGTTYALAAGMLHEAVHLAHSNSNENSVDQELKHRNQISVDSQTSEILSAAAISLESSATISAKTTAEVSEVDTTTKKGQSVSFDEVESDQKIAVQSTRTTSKASATADATELTSESTAITTQPDQKGSTGLSKPNSRINSKESSRRNSDNPIPQPTMSRAQLSMHLWDNAFHTAQGIHDAGWEKFGYWFATPEAWEKSGNYRSLGYMRPLSIWAMQFALEKWNEKKPTNM